MWEQIYTIMIVVLDNGRCWRFTDGMALAIIQLLGPLPFSLLLTKCLPIVISRIGVPAVELIFELPENKVVGVQGRVNKAALRARKSGLPVPTMNVDQVIEREHYVHDALARINGNSAQTRRVVSRMAVVRLANFSPDVGDFSFVGSRYYKRNKEGDVVTSNFGCIPDEIGCRDKLCCDHCGYSRNRSISWVLQNNKDEKHFEVGSSCVEAFTGYRLGHAFHEGLQEVGKILHSIKQFADENPEADPMAFDEDVRLVLAVAIRHVSDHGFVSSSQAKLDHIDASWRHVMTDLVKYRRDDLGDDEILVTEADFLAADDLVQHFVNNSDRDFNRNVVAATMKKYASMHDVAMLTAAASSYIEKLKRDQKAANVRSLVERSLPVRDVGERFEFVGKVFSVKEFEGHYGVVSYITLIDADNNLLSWKASGTSKLDQGEAYVLRGTVKKHRLCERGYFEGIPETVITRVAVERKLGPASFMPANDVSTLSADDEDALESLLGTMNF